MCPYDNSSHPKISEKDALKIGKSAASISMMAATIAGSCGSEEPSSLYEVNDLLMELESQLLEAEGFLAEASCQGVEPDENPPQANHRDRLELGAVILLHSKSACSFVTTLLRELSERALSFAAIKELMSKARGSTESLSEVVNWCFGAAEENGWDNPDVIKAMKMVVPLMSPELVSSLNDDVHAKYERLRSTVESAE